MDGWKTFSFPFGTIPQVNYRFGMVVASMIDRTGFRFPTSVFLGKIFCHGNSENFGKMGGDVPIF